MTINSVLKLVAATAVSGRGKEGALFGATKDTFLSIYSTFPLTMYSFMFGEWQVEFDPVMDWKPLQLSHIHSVMLQICIYIQLVAVTLIYSLCTI